jgi:hypothetical protein
MGGRCRRQASGDVFYLSKASGSDFALNGDVRLVSGVAVAITFRATKDVSRHYPVNVDADAGVMKLWHPGPDIAAYPLVVERGREYHFKVATAGPSIRCGWTGTGDRRDRRLPVGGSVRAERLLGNECPSAHRTGGWMNRREDPGPG